jgi:secreted PhoX family phosphatase
LSSEEYEPDAVNIAGNTMFQAFSQNLFGTPTAANPYHYGHVPEVTVNPDGTASIEKHYGMGRIARELVQVMPDNKTVLMGDDGTNTGLFMFIADTAKDLSAGTLYVAKWTQTSASAGGAGTLAWIKLGSASSDYVKALADNLKPGDIVTVTKVDPVDPSYTKIAFNGTTEWVKFAVGKEKAAAFLETHRYAAAQGASMEFTKMEGVTLNAKDKLVYVAISYLYKTMSDVVGDIRLPVINAGATFQLTLSSAQKDTSGATIASDWVPTVMAAVPALVGEDLATPDAVGNTANPDKVANPDNLKFSEKLRTLYIGEDSGMHVNNFLWAYNVDTKKLSRILSVPAGAESTGLQAVDNLNGFAYIMSNFQHAGDWTGIHSLVKAGADPLINSNWNNKKSAAVGYLSGLPAL